MSSSYNIHLDLLWGVPTIPIPDVGLFRQDGTLRERRADELRKQDPSLKQTTISRVLRKELGRDPNVLLIQGIKLGVYIYACYRCSSPSSKGYCVSSRRQIAAILKEPKSSVDRAISNLSNLLMADPVDAERLDAGTVFRVRDVPMPLREALYKNNQTYVTVPNQVAQHLDQYIGDPLDLIVGLSKEAHERGVDFVMTTQKMMMCSGISKHKALAKAIESTEKLFSIEPCDKRNAAYHVSLLHPETQEPLVDAKETARLKAERKEYYKDNSEERTGVLRLNIKDLLDTTTQRNGEEVRECPRCKGPKPLTINPTKHHYGTAYCHNGCGINKMCKTAADVLAEVMEISVANAKRLFDGKEMEQVALAGEGVAL